jgi:hypothetical protein
VAIAFQGGQSFVNYVALTVDGADFLQAVWPRRRTTDKYGICSQGRSNPFRWTRKRAPKADKTTSKCGKKPPKSGKTAVIAVLLQPHYRSLKPDFVIKTT